jgi:Protein of unknown function (DUF1800)
MHAIIGTPEFWTQAFLSGKVKTPHEYVVSALRAVGAEVSAVDGLVRGRDTLAAMGMPTYEALDPTGWSDRGADWLPNPGSHLARMNFALALVSQALPGIAVDLRPLLGGADPSSPAEVTAAVNQRVFGGSLPPDVIAACGRVAPTGALQPAFRVVGIALASPAFQVK